MRYFQEVDLAESCYVYEAAEWIVRGRAPAFAPDEDGREIRGDIRAYHNGYQLFPEPLTPQEVKAFAVGLSYDEYLDALMDTGPAPDAFLSAAEVAGGKWDEAAYNAWRAACDERERDVQSRLDRALMRFSHHMERAKAQVVAALVQGSISAKGFWFASEEEFDDRDYSVEPPLEVIPHELISPNTFDWERHSMKCIAGDDRPEGGYFLITLETRQVLKTFSPPQGDMRSILVVNSNAILEEHVQTPDAEEKVPKRRRGRPYKTDWIRDGMRSWYQSQCQKGKTGTGNIESDLAAAKEWAADAGVSLARSTVQNYLADLLR